MLIRTWEVDCEPRNPRNNYDISKILKLIKIQFHMVVTNKTFNLKINPYQYHIEINPNVYFAIARYAKSSIFKLLRFKSQSSVIETSQKRNV